MITIPAGQCHWCFHWKENIFGRCESCYRFQPMKNYKSSQLSPGKRLHLQSQLLKLVFTVLKHVHFFVHKNLNFTHSDLFEVRTLIFDAYHMISDPTYKSSEHPDLLLEDFVAAILYKLGLNPHVTQFIDECNLMYGYGKCSSVGDFQFTIPHRFLKPGTTLRTFPVLLCKLDTRHECIQMHSYREVA